MNKLWRILGKTSPKARITLAVFAIIAIVLLFWLWQRNAAPKNPEERPHPIVRADLINDTDEDGLKDWEEALFRTNSGVADTDGDGTNDGEEIRKGRDPLKSGPEDALATSTARVAQTFIGAIPEGENLTERVAGLFVTQYLTPRLADPEFTSHPELLAQDALEATLAKTAQEQAMPRFSPKDVSLAPEDNSRTVRAYLANLDQAIRLSFKTTPPSEKLIQNFLAAIEKETYSSFKNFDKYLAEYDSFFERAKKLAIPASLANQHLRYLNAAAQEYEALKRMRLAAEDAVGALAGFHQYIDATDILLRLTHHFQTSYRNLSSQQ